MQALKALSVAAAVVVASAANLRRGGLSAGVLAWEGHSHNVSLLQEDSSAKAVAELMVSELLRSRTSLHQAMDHIGKKMSIDEAMSRLKGKLPSDVTSLIGVGADATFSEESMDKARNILNHMIEEGFDSVERIVIECQAWKNSNRWTLRATTTDLTRLGSSIAEAEGQITDNYNCIVAQDKEYRAVDGTMQTELSNYMREFAADSHDLSLKKNDLEVFTFILSMVKCASTTATTAFLQLNASADHSTWRVCSTSSGLELEFGNPLVQQKAEKMMTPAIRKAINDALALVTLSETAHQQAKSTANAHATTPFNFAVTASPMPVKEDPPKSIRNCPPDWPSNPEDVCARLTDKLALQWGKFKDLVDELQADMDRKKDTWDQLRQDLNDQMDVIAGQKATCQTKFAEWTGTKNTLTAESDAKTEQYHELEAAFTQEHASCQAQILDLLSETCACKQVRNKVLETHPTSSPDKIQDCIVDDWTAAVCSVPCDDSCPKMVGGVVDPFSCGGTRTLTRRIVVAANAFGTKCPSLSAQTRCGQYKCPVDCVMSEWSGWSKCSKDCGGGERQRTRSILNKPKHGGKWCDSPVDTEPCNTGSCDRNCALADWTSWSFCSMSCNPGHMPGFKERVRKVMVPIRGFGTCPAEDSAPRYEKAVCNDQACIGDEICVAKQDLIILMDGSGSMDSDGFGIVKDFVKNVTGYYYPEYYGGPAVRIGVVLFGNGEVLADGSIKPAIQVSPLTANFNAVRTAVEATTWQKGFTNLAQAFILADNMFTLSGRADALAGVLVLWDGKPNFSFQTTHAANTLKEKGAMVYMAPISEKEGDWETPVKLWASQPWETNYMRIPGYQALKYNMQVFSPAVIAKFCSDAISPTLQAAVDDRRGYMLIHEGGFPSDSCGRWVSQGYMNTLDECAEKAMNIKYQAFSITEPKSWFGGKRHCYSEAIKFTQAQWTSWLTNRVSVPCVNGVWLNNPYYDVYAIEFFPTATTATR